MPIIPKSSVASRERAEELAVKGLQYIGGDSEVLNRFLSLSGISPYDLRDMSRSPDFLPAILDFFLGDEPTLLAFAASIGEDPGRIARARALLRGPMSDDIAD